MAKFIYFKKTYNDSIIEIRFGMARQRGWFNEHVTPAIALIKGTVPGTERSFNPTTKLWEVPATYWFILSEAYKATGWTLIEEVANKIPKIEVPFDYAENFYHKQEVITQKESAASIAAQLSTYLEVEITTQDVSELKKLYRRKAMELHPDRNPENAPKMSELNRLWTLFTAQDKVIN